MAHLVRCQESRSLAFFKSYPCGRIYFHSYRNKKLLCIERIHNGADPVISLLFFSGSQSETFLVSKNDSTLILEATC